MQPAASYLRPVNLSPEQWIGDCCRNLGPSPLKLLASFFGLFQQLATRLSQMDFVRACSLSREQSVKNGAGRRQEQQQRAKRGAKTNKVRIENKVFSSSEPRPVINSRLIVLFFFMVKTEVIPCSVYSFFGPKLFLILLKAPPLLCHIEQIHSALWSRAVYPRLLQKQLKTVVITFFLPLISSFVSFSTAIFFFTRIPGLISIFV